MTTKAGAANSRPRARSSPAAAPPSATEAAIGSAPPPASSAHRHSAPSAAAAPSEACAARSVSAQAHRYAPGGQRAHSPIRSAKAASAAQARPSASTTLPGRQRSKRSMAGAPGTAAQADRSARNDG